MTLSSQEPEPRPDQQQFNPADHETDVTTLLADRVSEQSASKFADRNLDDKFFEACRFPYGAARTVKFAWKEHSKHARNKINE